jgi:hypothetical protein
VLVHACNVLALEVYVSILSFALVLTAAFCYATWNYFLKRINAGPELVWLCSVLSVMIYLYFATYFVSTITVFYSTQIIYIAGSNVLQMGIFCSCSSDTGRGICQLSTRRHVQQGLFY